MREVIIPRLANKLIVYEIVSSLTLIAQERVQWFGIGSLQDRVRFDIDSSRSCPVVWH